MFTPQQAVTAAGMEKQKPTFDRWLQANIARPTHPSQGRGFPAEWSGSALVALLLTKRLGRVGVELKQAANIAALATKDWEVMSIMGWEVAVDLDNMEFKISTKLDSGLADWRKGRGLVLVIDMDVVEETIIKRLGIRRDEL